MANFQSPEITLLEASPRGIADQTESGSAIVKSKGTFEFTPTAANTLQLARVPVDSTLDSLRLAFDDNGATITIDCGYYLVGAPGGVVDQNALITLLDTSTAALPMAEQRFETQEINTITEKQWELANLSARPSYNQFDIVLTVVTGTTPVVGTVSWYIEYSL